MSIYLIDDDVDLAELIAESLQDDFGLQIKSFSDGLSAVSQVMSELIVDSSCELIITDYKMPGMDGAELIGSVRENDYMGPIILITGMHNEVVSELQAQDDNLWVLHKPFSLVNLKQLISKTLTSANGQQAA